MRLIDADVLMENRDVMVGDITVGKRCFVMLHEIEDAPTIDAVEVVLCKNCKHCNSNDGYASMNPQWAGFCTLIKKYPFRNWFCASGERKDDPQTETPTFKEETPTFDAETPTNRPSLHEISQLVVNDCIHCEQVGRCERGRAVDCPLTERSK